MQMENKLNQKKLFGYVCSYLTWFGLEKDKPKSFSLVPIFHWTKPKPDWVSPLDRALTPSI